MPSGKLNSYATITVFLYQHLRESMIIVTSVTTMSHFTAIVIDHCVPVKGRVVAAGRGVIICYELLLT